MTYYRLVTPGPHRQFAKEKREKFKCLLDTVLHPGVWRKYLDIHGSGEFQKVLDNGPELK